MRHSFAWKCVVRFGGMCFVPAVWLNGAALDYLTGKSTAVVVGSVSSRIEGAKQVSFTINVARVITGSVQGTALNVVHPWAGAVRGPGSAGSQPLYGIWFLLANADGSWDVLPARPSEGVRSTFGLYLPASLAPPSGPYSIPDGTAPLDALTYEVAAGIQSASAGSRDGDPKILLDAYRSMNTASVQSVLVRCLASSTPGLQAIGLAGSLERSMAGAVQTLAQVWAMVAADPHFADVVSALRDSWRNPDPSGVRQLAALASATPAGADLRGAAVRALASIHTKETLPFLATLLASTDFTEQERAVYGVSAFANGCPMQTNDNAASMAYLQCDQPTPYRTADTVANFGFRPGPPDQEAALVSFWQSWWSDHVELH